MDMAEKFPIIPQTEFTDRIAAFRRVMQQNGVQLAVGFSNLLDPSTVRYFSDFAAVNESAAIVIPLTGRITVCAGQASSDYARIKNRLTGSEVKIFPEIGEVSGFEYDFGGQLDFSAFFGDTAAEYPCKKIGYLGQLIFPAVIFNKLRAAYPKAELVCMDRQLYELRMRKSSAEIACMRKSADIISRVFGSVVPRIKEGDTELSVQAMFEGEMLAAGGESYVQSFAPMISSGSVNSHISMCRSSRRRLGEGEIVNLAAGVCYEGYNGIICSPYVLGRVPQKIAGAVNCAVDALNAASAKMTPGTGAAEILHAYTDYLKRYGYLEYCPYGSLHSTGMLECEAPIFSVANDRKIQKNMTMCVDAYFKGMEWGSFRVEDIYVITDKGAERLTSYNDSALKLLFSGEK